MADEPWERPRDAREVALAMTRYEHSVAERLRNAELKRVAAETRTAEEERIRKMAEAQALEERRRRQVTFALATAVVALVLVGGAGVSWWVMERRAAEQDVHTALDTAASYSTAGRWPEARAALERVEERLGTRGSRELRERVRQARLDAEIVAELDEIRLLESEATWVGLKDFDLTKANASYQAALARYGLKPGATTPGEDASLINRSRVRVELLAGLHDWLRIKPAGDQKGLSDVLEVADDDAWRRSFRTAALAKDIPRLKELALQQEAWDQPPTVQYWLAWELQFKGGIKEAETLLRKGQQHHPSDFWLNYQLGLTLLFAEESVSDRPQEAVGFLRSAVAARPSSSAAHNLLGAALNWCGLDGALDEYRQAIVLDPKSGMAHNNLADLLANSPDPKLRDPVQAVAEAQKAVELDSKLKLAWITLGQAHYRAGQWQAAITALEKGLQLGRDGNSEEFLFLAMAHERIGHKDEARKWYQKGVEWMEKNAPKNPTLLQYRAEAAQVLGLK
jgi:tetratricopeptide (TPR) repeat protein